MFSVVSLISSSAGCILSRWFSNSRLFMDISIYNRYTCKWDWTEILTVSFPLRAKTVKFIFAWIQNDVGGKMSTIRTHWIANYLLEDFSYKTTKIFSTRNSSILMMSSSEYFFFESDCSFTKYVIFCRALIPDMCIDGYHCWKWKRSWYY